MELLPGWIQPVPASTELSENVLPSPLLPSGLSRPHAMATQMFLVCTCVHVFGGCVWSLHKNGRDMSALVGGGGASSSRNQPVLWVARVPDLSTVWYWPNPITHPSPGNVRCGLPSKS